MGKLTATAVEHAKKVPGKYEDGEGLRLEVRGPKSASWIVRVQKDRKRQDIGLGSASKVSLKLARERASKVRSQIEAGINPIAERKRAAGIPTFRQAAALVHAQQEFTNSKHRAQWLSSLEAYAYPFFGDVSVAKVGEDDVLDALAAIWSTKQETARRVRQRIRIVLNWAMAKKYRDKPLPWEVVNAGLPKRRDKVKHHPALPYEQMGEFFAKLREGESMGRLALEAVILTAARSGEVRNMTWDELDLKAATWTVPADRMKMRKEHVVTLSAQAVALFERMKSHKRVGSDLVFPANKRDKALSENTLGKVIRLLHNASVRDGGIGFFDPKRGRVASAHGFRSTFRDWVSEETKWPDSLAEKCLAHEIKNQSEAAYKRGEMLKKRRELMADWSNYCEGRPTSEMVIKEDSA